MAQLLLISTAAALALSLVLTAQFLPSRYQFNEGDVVTFNIKSPHKVTYISQLATKEERDRAAAEVAEVTEVDAGAAPQQLRKADELLLAISEIRRGEGTFVDKQKDLTNLPGSSLSEAAARELLVLDDFQWTAAAIETRRVLSTAMGERFTAKQQSELAKRIPHMVDQSLPAERREAIAEIVVGLLRPTLLVDEAATVAARAAARDGVDPVRVTVEKGEIILRDGDVVKRSDIEKLEQVGLSNPGINWRDILGNSLLVVALVGVMAAYLYLFQPHTWSNARRLTLVYAIIVVAVLTAKLVVPGRDLFAYAFPAAAVPMLIATLLDVQLAVVAIALLAPAIGLVAGGSLELATVALVGGLVGLLGVWRLERQIAFWAAGLAVGVASFLVVASFKLVGQDIDPQQLALVGLLCLVNGILSTMVTLGMASILGHIFGVTTSLGLLELAHPTQPLFRRLLAEAPGTYHHSVIVANLSERAAQVVGADSLLARVGSYYHDIGKVSRPYCFVENQFEGRNVHDTLAPQVSAKLVAAHVKDGLALAGQYGLPSKVRDVIEQHHGTRLVKYFYHRACQDGCNGVSVDDFSYPGPRPQTKEAAIVMLADSVEAALRSADDQSAEGIAKLVDKIVGEILLEGQLNECDLSLRDIDRIKEAFGGVLQGIFHPRVKYPEMDSIPPAGEESAPVMLPSGGSEARAHTE